MWNQKELIKADIKDCIEELKQYDADPLDYDAWLKLDQMVRAMVWEIHPYVLKSLKAKKIVTLHNKLCR